MFLVIQVQFSLDVCAKLYLAMMTARRLHNVVTFFLKEDFLRSILIFIQLHFSKIVMKHWIIVLKKCGRSDLNVFHLKWIIGNWKKSKYWGLFWSYQLDSNANPAHLPQNWAKLAKSAILFSWQLQNGSQNFDFF